MTNTLPWRSPPQYIQTFSVTPADIDDFQHVNNVVYLHWMAKTAWAHSKELGFDMARYKQEDCGFVVRHHEIDYQRATPPADTIHCGTWITKNDGRLHLRRRFQMMSETLADTVAFGLSDFVTMRISTGRAQRMPEIYKTGYFCQPEVEALFTRA